MPIDFPSSPANNQIYTYGGQSWYWANNYGVWEANTASTQGGLGFTGSIGSIGFTGSTGDLDFGIVYAYQSIIF